MNTFFAWCFGFLFSGFLLKAYCPEPTTLPAAVQEHHAAWLAGQAPMPEIYANAHYLWFAYCGVGAISFVAMLLYIFVTNRIDAKQAAAPVG
jgi:hypothetical protein